MYFVYFFFEGVIYNGHRLLELSKSNQISKQKLYIRNASIHIKVDKLPVPSKRNNNERLNATNLKIWIFRLTGNDLSSKNFDQVATLCTSLKVNLNTLGWQKIDITETVQDWYAKNQHDKLRLLIDCTGCGNQYVLHIFDENSRRKDDENVSDITVENNNNNNNDNDEFEIDNQTNSQAIANTIANKINNNQQNGVNLRQNQQQIHDNHQHHHRKHHHQHSRGRNRLKPYRNNFNENNKSSINFNNINKFKTNLIESDEQFKQTIGAEAQINPNRPFLVLHTAPIQSRRSRRRAVDCSSAAFGQCCKESFYVSFKALGWDDWIIAPKGYFANYCRGDCTGPYRTPDTFHTFHSHFIEEYRKMGLVRGMHPCCAPLKFSSMSLIYYGDNGIIKRDLPKMVVDECGCP